MNELITLDEKLNLINLEDQKALEVLKIEIDNACALYEVNVAEVGIDIADENRKTITKYKNKAAKWFKDKRDHYTKMAKGIITIEKNLLESMTLLEEKLKTDIEAEKVRQERKLQLKKLPQRQAYLNSLGLIMDDEHIIDLNDIEFNDAVEAMQKQIEDARIAKEQEEQRIAKAKEEARREAEEAAAKAAAKAKADAERALKETEEKAEKARIKQIGESRYEVIEGLGLVPYLTASKQIVIDKAGQMDTEEWNTSLAVLKARKMEAEEQAEAEKQKALELEEKARLEALKGKGKGLKIETVWDEEDQINLFIVSHDGVILAKEPTWCEAPEDASLDRQFSWVKPLLKKVYDLGYEDGYYEGGTDATSI